MTYKGKEGYRALTQLSCHNRTSKKAEGRTMVKRGSHEKNSYAHERTRASKTCGVHMVVHDLQHGMHVSRAEAKGRPPRHLDTVCRHHDAVSRGDVHNLAPPSHL